MNQAIHPFYLLRFDNLVDLGKNLLSKILKTGCREGVWIGHQLQGNFFTHIPPINWLVITILR